MRAPRESGFTLVEMSVTIVILVPVLYVALNTTGILTRSVATNERNATVHQTLTRVTNQLYTLTRPALTSTVQVRNNRTDGWSVPAPDTPYPALRFATDDPIEPITELEFVRDIGEISNGADDDGDGLVDEGSLQIRRGGDWITIATGIEALTFSLASRLMTFTMACAHRDDGGRVLRGRRDLRVYLRNS